jgi:endonuclease YncB( thermonuclease family)
MTCPPHRGVSMFIRHALISAALVFGAPHALAGLIVGRVVKVADGDTIVVLDDAQVTHRIRLGAIDAPERGQPYNRIARKSLAELVQGKTVRVRTGVTDRYGRDVGVVRVGDLDVNRLQVERGMAWWYRHYADEQSPADRVRYRNAEQDARTHRRGLWARSNPVEPWVWRHSAVRDSTD